MTKRKIYISGPMTGLQEHNFPAFHQAAESLAQLGFEPINPADNFGGRRDLPRETYLRKDVQLLAECDGIAMLRGWRNSRGAKLEYHIAQELGLERLHQFDGRWWLNSTPEKEAALILLDSPINAHLPPFEEAACA